MPIDDLMPRPGRFDYLIASGSRALVSDRPQEGWPFSLSAYSGRSPAGVMLTATSHGPSLLSLSIGGDLLALAPIDLSLFVRACIRRSNASQCTLTWPAIFALDDGDPLAPRIHRSGSRSILEAGYVDLRPTHQTAIEEVYRYPLDVPWLYDPLDYEVMIPLLNSQGIRRVLDLGCGSGRNSVPLENAGYEMHGIDSAAESPEVCRHFVRAPERFQQASAFVLPYGGDYFDAVLDVGCLHMLETSAERRMALAEAARVLRPGGFLCGRALTPREPQWLSAQPFRSSAAGFCAADIVSESRPYFTAQILGQTRHLLYYKLLKVV